MLVRHIIVCRRAEPACSRLHYRQKEDFAHRQTLVTHFPPSIIIMNRLYIRYVHKRIGYRNPKNSLEPY